MPGKEPTRKKLASRKKTKLQEFSIDLPLHTCTIGYDNAVKMANSDGDILLHGPFTLEPQSKTDKGSKKMRVRVRWKQSK